MCPSELVLWYGICNRKVEKSRLGLDAVTRVATEALLFRARRGMKASLSVPSTSRLGRHTFSIARPVPLTYVTASQRSIVNYSTATIGKA